MTDFSEDFDLGSWFIRYMEAIPHGYVFAKAIHGTPASSAGPERVFSQGGLIISDRHGSLDPEHAREHVLVRMNRDALRQRRRTGRGSAA